MAVCWKCAGHCVGFEPEEINPGRPHAALSILPSGHTCLDPKDGELRAGTSPCPVMATRLIVPEEQLRAAGWSGELP
jgi:hypothetical protein